VRKLDGCKYNVARWLSPKPAKSHHEKLLDPAKNPVTNFQLKPAKNSEIVAEKLPFQRFSNETCKAMYQFLILHSQSMDQTIGL